MTIQPLTIKQNNGVSPSKSTPNEKVPNTNVQASKKANDSVDITTVAKQIAEGLKSPKSTPVINEKRVEEVRQLLENGDYPINAEEIARKMIEAEREQYNNSR